MRCRSNSDASKKKCANSLFASRRDRRAQAPGARERKRRRSEVRPRPCALPVQAAGECRAEAAALAGVVRQLQSGSPPPQVRPLQKLDQGPQSKVGGVSAHSECDDDLNRSTTRGIERGDVNSKRVKGFGFITPDDRGDDVFVHVSAAERSGLQTLSKRMRLGFDVEADRQRGKPRAANSRLL
jgi:cold shock protein